MAGFPAIRWQAGLLLCCAAFAGTASAATLKAEYLFGNSFASSLSGAPDLVAVNPLGSNGFSTDTVFGQSRTVYATNGNGNAQSNQAGLTLDTTGLVTANSYTVEMVFEITGGNPVYKRLLQTGMGDNGLYVGGSVLNTYVNGNNNGLPFSSNTYHDLVLTVTGGVTQAWLDGVLSHTVATTALNITASGDIVRFFIDDATEYTNARTAVIRMWDGALGSGDILALAAAPLNSQAAAIPEPAPLALLLAGLGLLGVRRRKH